MVRFQQVVMSAVPHAHDIYQFAYPPFLLLLMAPIGALPFWPGWMLWLTSGWVCFALLIRRSLPKDWALYSAALPAVFINVVAGQNGLWTAAIIGWGLTLLSQRPWMAGAILSLMLYKPQLAFLIPLALLAGSRWQALAGFAGSAVTLFIVTSLVYGPEIWQVFLLHSQVVRTLILEQGTGISHRMISVFVLLRHMSASLGIAYAAQSVATVIVAALVALVWRSTASETLKHCSLVLGIVLATPYVFDYDLTFLAFVPLWLSREDGVPRWRLHGVILTLLPILAAPLAKQTSAAAGILFLVPLFAIVARAALRSSATRFPPDLDRAGKQTANSVASIQANNSGI